MTVRTTDDMKTEAVQRMRLMKIIDQTIKDFVDEEKLTYSQNGMNYWLIQGEEDQDKPILKAIATMKEKGHLPYFLLFTPTTLGNMWSIFYINESDEEWELDNQGLASGEQLVYVFNEDLPDCSEYGYINFKPAFGGVVRTA